MKTETKQHQEEHMLISNFSKYDFVKSYIKDIKTASERSRKEKEASLIADAIKESNDVSIKDLATKKDLSNTESLLKSDLKDTKTELKTEISDLKTELKIEISDLKTELKADIVRLDNKIDTKFDSLKKDMETMSRESTIKTAAIMTALLVLFKAFDAFI